MKWYGITGSWQKTSPQVEKDVRTAVKAIIDDSNGIVTGGALNVDFFAVSEALKADPTGQRIKVCLPTTLELYAAHFRQRAEEGFITKDQAESLIDQLTELKAANADSVLEHPTNTVINEATYFERNTQIVDLSDEVLGFQVNKSEGTQDTIDKAALQGKPVTLKEYKVD